MHEFSENQFGVEQQKEPGFGGRPEERRRHNRYAVEGEAEVIVADGSRLFRGRILDISLSGCFIETSARLRLAVGTRVAMVFRANGALLRTTAAFRALRPGKGAGFLFVDLNDRTKMGLERLIAVLERSR